jgi:hypothetical protein
MAFSDFTFTIFRGDTRSFVITVTKNGTPYNLTGCGIWFTGKAQLIDAPYEAIFSVGTETGQVIFTDAVNGIATITLQALDTANVRAETLAYCDVQVRDPGGAIATVASGMLTIMLDVTETA